MSQTPSQPASESAGPLFQTPTRPSSPPASTSSTTIDAEPDTTAGATLSNPVSPESTQSTRATSSQLEDPSSWSEDELPEDEGPGGGWFSALLSSRSSHARREEVLPHAETAVRGVGEVLHTRLTAPGSAEREVGLFLPDEEDVTNIAAPVAGLVSRRLPEGVASPDVADLIALAAGVAGWAVKQIRLRRRVRRALADAAAAAAAAPAAEEQAA
jgi:hypothetical protein